MKRYFLLVVVLFCIALAACKKGNDPATQASVDDAKLLTYLQANAIFDAKKDPSGFYYEIVNYGPSPNVTTNFPVGKADTMVKVAYTGKYLNGQTFNALATNTLNLSPTSVDAAIAGFRSGIPLINTGGRIRLFIPSALAYGPTGSSDGGIPPNACLIFTVDLLGFY